ncbi:hypothetical protein JCM10450v2_002466 [Rhodotorula kratochvilovae]
MAGLRHRNTFGSSPTYEEATHIWQSVPNSISISRTRWAYWPSWVRQHILATFAFTTARGSNMTANGAEELLYPGLYYEHAIKEINKAVAHPFPLPPASDTAYAPGTVSHRKWYPDFPIPHDRVYTFKQLEECLDIWEHEVELRKGPQSRNVLDIRHFRRNRWFASEREWDALPLQERVIISANFFNAHIINVIGVEPTGVTRLIQVQIPVVHIDALEYFPHLWPEESGHTGPHPTYSLGTSSSHRRMGMRMAQIYGTTQRAFAAGRAFA